MFVRTYLSDDISMNNKTFLFIRVEGQGTINSDYKKKNEGRKVLFTSLTF